MEINVTLLKHDDSSPINKSLITNDKSTSVSNRVK